MTDGGQQEVHGPKTETATEAPRAIPCVQTVGHRLETVGNIPLSRRDRLNWQAAFTVADVLQHRLQANGIGGGATPEVQRTARDVFTTDIAPVLDQLKEMFDPDKPLSDEELEEHIGQVERMYGIGMESLSQRDVMHVLTLRADEGGGDAALDEARRLLNIWVHDTKGKLTAPRLTLQMLSRMQSTDAKYESRVNGLEQQLQHILPGLAAVIATGLPFRDIPIEADATTETLAGVGAEQIYPHEPVSSSALVAMIEASVADFGQGLNLHLGQELQNAIIAADWDPRWAQRMIENVISNAQKAHRAAGNESAEQIVDVFMGVVGGQLVMVFGDRGKGYPGEMVAKWNDPSQRNSIPTGWTREGIESTGVGLREHAAILAEQYHGGIEIFNFGPEGGAATIVRIPLAPAQ